MENFITRILLIFLLSQVCFTARASRLPVNDSIFLIKSIDSINNWYVICASKGDSVYKIVVEKQTQKREYYKDAIVVGRKYRLQLHSRKKEPLVINGVKVQPMNYLDIQCYSYDEKTKICIDPKHGIFDLFSTPNLRGLSYVPINR